MRWVLDPEKTYTYGFITPRTIAFKHQGVNFLGCEWGYKHCKYRFKFIIPVKPIYKAINLCSKTSFITCFWDHIVFYVGKGWGGRGGLVAEDRQLLPATKLSKSKEGSLKMGHIQL